MDSSKLESQLSYMHKIWELLESFDETQINNFNTLLTLIAIDDKNFVVNYVQGVVGGIQLKKYDICPTCQVKHEKNDYNHIIGSLKQNATATEKGAPQGYV